VLLFLPLLFAAQSYHGYSRHDFKVDGLDAVLVEPKTPDHRKPWIWRMEFFDHRPELDLALLAKGYYLAHIEVGNTFGCPTAMEHCSAFYRELTSHWGLSPKPILEGFSRGALYAYNWAVRNPDKVGAIYGDAPVCDFTTWPYGGRGGARSDSDWKELISDYGFPSEQAALDYPFNPINNLEPLAKAHIPIIHVVGDKDTLVPMKENTGVLAARYNELGGKITVLHKPNGDHHPHSLDDPTPIVEFLTRHAHDSVHAEPATVIPAPNPESRYSAAGWNGRSWMDQVWDSERAAITEKAEVVLLGDSITQGWGGPGRQVSAPGAEAFARAFHGWRTVEMGMSGDRTQNVLWRLKRGTLVGVHPKAVVIAIGINNRNDDSAEAVAKGTEALVREVRSQAPGARVIVTGLFPTGPNPDDPQRAYVKDVNGRLKGLRSVEFIDIGPELLLPDGHTDFSKMAGDSLHLAPGGYEVWGKALRATLQSLGV